MMHTAAQCGFESWKSKPQSERTRVNLRAAVLAYARQYTTDAEMCEQMVDQANERAERMPWLFAR